MKTVKQLEETERVSDSVRDITMAPESECRFKRAGASQYCIPDLPTGMPEFHRINLERGREVVYRI
ncbi:MAG: hypothetical protein BWK80_46935 [Desulfobacteraceae bacterium IS3]|nr:MAG: hypothetical protein BWK80_46935 [Desulfobacteraceae bacterium IS3]